MLCVAFYPQFSFCDDLGWARFLSVSYDVLVRVRGEKICDRHRIWNPP